MIDFEEIKSRHPIEAELEKRNVVLKRAPGGYVARCPIHGGKKSWAFSVNTKKQVWFCFSACQRGGDVFNLVMELDGASNSKAAAEILEGRPLTHEERARTPVKRALMARSVETRVLPSVPKLYKGEERHFKAVAELRKLSWSAMAEAHKEGCMRFCVAYDQPAYAVLDVENPCNVQVRRMDGKLWFESHGDGKKVMGVKGNWAPWPVGLSAALRHPNATLLFGEGTGDFLAGWDIRCLGIADCIPVAMFGAGQSIHPSALPLFEGRKVILIQQHDDAGERATANWRKQLSEQAHARASVWKVPGEGEDLNNFVSGGGDPEVIFKEAV